MTSKQRTGRLELQLARSTVYEFLALVLAYPEASRLQHLRDDLRPELRALPAGTLEPAVLHPVLELLDLPLTSLQRDFALIFTHTVSPDCPTYETAYSARDIFQQAQSMADVAGFYRAHGLKVGGRERERPDYIATELEFMSFMALKQAYAMTKLGPEQVESCVEAQRLFLRDHLGRWGASLGSRTAMTATAQPFYAAAGRLLAAWLEADCLRLQTGPIALLDEPLVPIPEVDDGACGGPDGSCPLIDLKSIAEVT